MVQHQVEGSEPPEDPSTFEKKQAWRMRWVVLIAFLIIFLCSLVVIGVTNNPFLVSLPGSLLLFLRPVMRYLFEIRSDAQRLRLREPGKSSDDSSVFSDKNSG